MADLGRTRRIGWGKKGQLGRGRVGGQGAQAVEPPHLQGAQAFVQSGFQRGFPARVHLQALPQWLQTVQTMAGKPGA
jgi:hypothetical protein